MMVQVDDRPVWFERRLLRRGEPILADGNGGGGACEIASAGGSEWSLTSLRRRRAECHDFDRAQTGRWLLRRALPISQRVAA